MSALAVLLLILIANGAPVLIRHLPGLKRWNYPLDGGSLFLDKRRWLGDSKTWRGLFASLISTTLAAPLLGFDWTVGSAIAALAMLGDSLSSFTKRRLGLKSSAMAPGLDQIPESLLPAMYAHYMLSMSWLAVLLIVLAFIVLELLLSRLLYSVDIRKRPY